MRVDPLFAPTPWPAQPTGTITAGPAMARGSRWWRRLPTYCVAFDTPQLDADGDGPYASAEVLGRYLRPL